MIEPAANLVAVAGTVAFSAVVSFAAQVAEAPGGVVTITSAGATFSAVGALVYIMRLWAAGKIVARPTADRDDALVNLATSLTKIVEEHQKREDVAQQREERFYQLIATKGGGA